MKLVKSVDNKALLAKALQCDIVTFDVFDTLITRLVLQPEDVFKLVEARAMKLGFGKGFATRRQQAEQRCYVKYGDRTSLQLIYKELQGFSLPEKEQLQALELELELKVVLPRKEVQELLLTLVEQGKRVILCSDMYLSSEFIQELLYHCGYPQDLELWVSNEVGLGKHDGKLWEQFFSEHKHEKTLHIGDNRVADGLYVEYYGHEACVLANPYDSFTNSEAYPYLAAYIDASLGASLIFGYLVHRVLYNSPFGAKPELKELGAVWMGPALGAFLEWLVAQQDDSMLLFLTREGYVLQPLYEQYCQELGIAMQPHSLFYASRTAVMAAAFTSKEDVKESLDIEFNGTFRQLLEGRFNLTLSAVDEKIGLEIIRLPQQKNQVLTMLEPYLKDILLISQKHRRAYLKYINEVKAGSSLPLTVVDVGYSGTIQYYLSKLTKEKVSGRYWFVTHNALPLSLGCSCKGLCSSRKGIHPIFENLLFLEGILQVPYGQLQSVKLLDDKLHFSFKEDIVDEPVLQQAQQGFAAFVGEMAGWKAYLGQEQFFDINAAQVLWLCLVKFRELPQQLLDCFRLQDDFAGNGLWRYDIAKQEWRSEHNVFPLVFSLVPGQVRPTLKARLKLFCKQRVPTRYYELARAIWIKYIK